MSFCNMCGRRLKSKESIKLGYGPGCYKKLNKNKKNDDKNINLRDIEKDILEETRDMKK